MYPVKRFYNQTLWVIFGTIAVLLGGYSGSALSADVKVTLSGGQEVPPVTTSASGSGTITIGADMSVSGSVKTTCAACTVAHIHEGSPEKNGPVIIPLTKGSDDTWSVPAGAKLSDSQFESFKAGNLYINAHSPTNKGGEIRGQLKP